MTTFPWRQGSHGGEPTLCLRAGTLSLCILFEVLASGCGPGTSLEGDAADGTDADVSIDCGEVGYALPTGGVGAPCAVDTDCSPPTVPPMIPPAACRRSFTTPSGEFVAPGGYCDPASTFNVPPPCSVGDHCLGSVYGPGGVPDPGVRAVSFDGSEDGLCIRLCHAAGDCRSGYSCMPLPPFVGYLGCLPSDLIW